MIKWELIRMVDIIAMSLWNGRSTTWLIGKPISDYFRRLRNYIDGQRRLRKNRV